MNTDLKTILLKEIEKVKLSRKEFIFSNYYIRNLKIENYRLSEVGDYCFVKTEDILINAIKVKRNSYELYLYVKWLSDLNITNEDDKNIKRILLSIEPIFNMFILTTNNKSRALQQSSLVEMGFKNDEDMFKHCQKYWNVKCYFIEAMRRYNNEEYDLLIEFKYKDRLVDSIDIDGVVKELLEHNSYCLQTVIRDEVLTDIVEMAIAENYPYSIATDFVLMDECKCDEGNNISFVGWI